MSTPGAVSAAAQPTATLGVLFVHGIGSQIRGRTLAASATPVVDWLTRWYDGLHERWAEQGLRFEDAERWLEERDGTDPRLLDAVRSLLDRLPRRAPGEDPVDIAMLSSHVGDLLAGAVRLTEPAQSDDAPNSARMVLTKVAVDGTVEQSSWLLAESWWAELVVPPSFGELARWGVGTITRTVGSHFGLRVRRATDTLRRQRSLWHVAALGVALAQLLLAVYASVLALAGLVLLLLLSAIPIPRLRTGVMRVQQALADSLGDSYALVTQPLQAAAIISRVRRDLAWLAARTEAVAVVAHSQGAAVVNEVVRQELAEDDPERRVLPDPGAPASRRRAGGQLRQVLTLGSGLRKLDELRRLLGPHEHFRRSALLTLLGAGVFTFSTLGLALSAGGADGWADVLLLAVYATVGLGLLVAGMLDMIGGAEAKELEWWVTQLQRTGVAWTDYVASADPVPNGPLFTADTAFPEHRPIQNRRSLLRDHTAYWSNTDQFVTDLVVRLARLDPTLAADVDGHDELFAFAQRRRRWRIAWLVAARWSAAVAGLAVLVAERAAWLPQLGRALQHLLAVVGVGPDAPAVDVPALLATMQPVAALAGAYAVAAMTWGPWDRHEAAQLLGRRRPGSGSFDALFLGATWLVAATAIVVSVPGVPLASPWLVAVFVGLVFAWFGTQLRVGAYASSSDDRAGRPRTKAEAFGRAAWSLMSAGATLLGFVLLAGVAWRLLTTSRLAAVIVVAVAVLAARSIVAGRRRRVT